MRIGLRQLATGALLSVLAIAAPATASAATSTVSTTEAESGTLDMWVGHNVTDPAASGGTAVEFMMAGSLHLKVSLPADATGVTLRVRGDQCAGAPSYTVTVDSAVAASGTAASTFWTNQSYSVPLLAGLHQIDIAYTNDYSTWSAPACDRNLYLDSVTFTASGVAPQSAALPAGFVHQSGTGLLDGAGRPIRLRGVDLGGWLLWEGWIWGQGLDYIGESAMMKNLASLVGPTAAEQFRSDVRANYITASDFHAISAYGFNVARVPFNYRLLEDDAHPFVYKQAGWDVLDRVISLAKQAHVYLVLDMHAAPCSQMLAFVSDYVGGPYLWNSSSCQDRMVAMWKAIAARYANENIIAGYDLLGETITDDASLLSLYKRVTAAIRQVDHNHVIIYEGNMMARTFTMFTQPLDSNEMLSFHDYPWAYPGQDLSVRMVGYDAAAKLMNAPQYVGEFGQSTYSDIQKYVTTFNNDPLVAAWTEWTWKQSPGFAALQTIQHTALSQKLINWINNPSRPQPTLAEAQQGMSDFINAIRFENTLPNALMRNIMAAPAPPPVASPTTTITTTTTATTTTTPTKTTTTTTTTTPVRRRASAHVARCLAGAHPRKAARHQRATRTRRAVACQWMASVKWDHRAARG